MRLLIDIGHPAHVHYFKHFAGIMRERGNQIYFSVRDKESAISLMETLDFDFEARGKGGKSAVTKLLKLLPTDIRLYRMARRFRPDIILSFSSPYAAHTAKVLGVPHIALDDTEHAIYGHALYRPFTDAILSPSCYTGPLHKKQILFSSYLELCHLHPNRFSPDPQILKELNLRKDEPYAVLRLVAWDAHHDAGQTGFSGGTVRDLVQHLEKKCRVFLSSEKTPDKELLPYQLTVHPSSFHDVLAFARLYIGEGSTTAAESSVLGTPSIYVNSLKVGYCTELEQRYGLCRHIQRPEDIAIAADEILTDQSAQAGFAQKRETMLREKIDPVAFLVWFVEEWPESRRVMRDDPDFQNRFSSAGISIGASSPYGRSNPSPQRSQEAP